MVANDQAQTISWEGKPVSTCFFGQPSFGNPAVVQSNSCFKVENSLDLAVDCSLVGGIQTSTDAISNVAKPDYPVEKDVRSVAIFELGAVGGAASIAAHTLSQYNQEVMIQIIAWT